MGCDIHTVVEVRRYQGIWMRAGRDLCADRNYDAFAVLANVRNGIGFAGTVMGGKWEPISEPRGFPPDFEKWSEEYLGDHSFSWVTLDELLRYNWGGKQTKRGCVTEEMYKLWKSSGDAAPDEFCGGVMGAKVVILSEQEYRANPITDPTKEVYIECAWQEPKSSNYLCRVTIPILKAIKSAYGVTDRDVRLVFGFDS